MVDQLFLSCRPGIWWLLGETSTHVGDLAAATGVPWEDILPLLVSQRFLLVSVTSTVSNVQVLFQKFDELFNSLVCFDRLQITKVHERHLGPKYFFCRGLPKFSNPMVQRKRIESAERMSPLRTMLFPLPGWNDRSFLLQLCRVSNQIISRNLVNRIMSEEERVTQVHQPQEEEEEQQQENNEWIQNKVQEQIEFALALDFQRRPRLSRSGATSIIIHDRKQANERERSIAIHTATQWGYYDPVLTLKRRHLIAEASCRQVSYDFGFQKPFAKHQLPRWYGELNKAIMGGESTDPLSPSHSGRKAYLDLVEKEHPGYLHELFRHSQRVLGCLATFKDLANNMNQKSAVVGEERRTLNMDRKQLAKWFKQQNGKEKSPIEKPLLTEQHKNDRLLWAQTHFDKLSNPSVPFAFLDEKWFYTTNRRRKVKILPKADCEQTAPDIVELPRIRSRRFPVKVMFLGVVACPNDEHDFDGKILLKRVSRRRQVHRASTNKRFSVDALVNDILKRGEESWHNLYTTGEQMGNLLERIAEIYDLDEFVSDRLQLSYISYTTGGNQKRVVMTNQDVLEDHNIVEEDGETSSPLTIDKLELSVAIRNGDEVDEDCTCDSEFMLETMPEVGQRLRECYSWIPQEQTIYLGMDNAGGHGTEDAKKIYTDAMKNYNVEIIWQVPRSPKTNMLDLGIWMSIQAAVTRTHRLRRCHHDALSASVYEAWNNYLKIESFRRVHARLRVVLRCIVDGKGSNALVESKRGKLYRDCTLEDAEEGGELAGDSGNKNNDANTTVINLAELDDSDDDSLGDL